jgi:VanW like protein
VTIRKGLPSRQDAALFHIKTWGLKCRRGLCDILAPVKRHKRPAVSSQGPASQNQTSQNQALQHKTPIAESRTPLYTSTQEVEWPLQLGKVENLRQAAHHMNGIVIPANSVFSFWKQLGPPLKQRGFVLGREVREGCIIPTIAGGICQLSNALYDCALNAGLTIHERHGHTAVVPGSATEKGRDATVFWNYVDLRFSHTRPMQLAVHLSEKELRVTFYELSSQNEPPSREHDRGPIAASSGCDNTATPLAHANSCDTCGVTECFRNQDLVRALPARTRETICLVDDLWPEFDGFLQQHLREQEPTLSLNTTLFLPLDGQKRNKSQYAWQTTGYAHCKEFPDFVAYRSLLSRFGHRSPAQRQALTLKLDKTLAHHYAKNIPHTATHLIVSQSLLPWLAQLGVLGGRSYDVLMTRAPLWHLTQVLDQAAQEYPSSPTLHDFRCARELIDIEKDALDNAQRWITPHSDIARLSPVPVKQLPWSLPHPKTSQPQVISSSSIEQQSTQTFRIGIIGPTLGRKGSYLVRDLVRRHPEWEWHHLGPVLETANFWEDLPITHHPQAHHTLSQGKHPLDLIIEPAIVEHRPRLALFASSLGYSVLTSTECGLHGVPNVSEVPTGSAENNLDVWDATIQQALQKNAKFAHLTPVCTSP